MRGDCLVLLLCALLPIVNCWVWECAPESGSCKRKWSVDSSNNASYSSFEICRLACGNSGNIWPLPTSYSATNKELVFIDAKNVAYTVFAPTTSAMIFLENVLGYFKDVINLNSEQNCKGDIYTFILNLESNKSTLKLNWNTSDEYDLEMTTDDAAKVVTVTITGITIFAVRRGIETLLQLIELYSDFEQTCYTTIKEVTIHDKPHFKHRGLLLDSARNYLSVDVIKKNIIAMAMSKMNVLHWHLSDTQSFPFMSSRLPNMSRYGAYSEKETYAPYQIRDLIQFGRLHGVRIVPEIDGPAHAGNGWQWGPEAGKGDLVVCYNQQPFRSYCIQPPCGQMNPANPELYNVLTDLYADIIDLWTESDLFHMGGDEVFIPCWNSSQEILDYIGTSNRSEEVFLNLWGEFQGKALKAYDLADNDTTAILVLWTSSLTDPEHIAKYLPKDRYVIQTWVEKSDPLPQELIQLGYKVIISTKDSWYLDHGFWGSTSYYTWRNIYDNAILSKSGVLGGEVCMWGELVDDNNVESRVWPRAAAAAERLWSNPTTDSIDASARFFSHSNRLAKRGIRTSPVIPEFCSQSDTDCSGYLNS